MNLQNDVYENKLAKWLHIHHFMPFLSIYTPTAVEPLSTTAAIEGQIQQSWEHMHHHLKLLVKYATSGHTWPYTAF